MARRREQTYTSSGEVLREESSWRYPLTILAITLGLVAVFLYVYVGPGVDELQGATLKPTISDERTTLTVGDVTLTVPASHTLYPRDRRPGEREALPLWAAWPRMDGYTAARRLDFLENRPNARRIDIVVEEKNSPLTESERLEVLYLPQTVDGTGRPAEHGLTRYTFRQGSATQPASGYADKTMYLGEAPDSVQAVLFCYDDREDAAVPPDCYRQFDLTDRVTVKYYFKRPYLPEWRRIDARVHELIERFAGGDA